MNLIDYEPDPTAKAAYICPATGFWLLTRNDQIIGQVQMNQTLPGAAPTFIAARRGRGKDVIVATAATPTKAMKALIDFDDLLMCEAIGELPPYEEAS